MMGIDMQAQKLWMLVRVAATFVVLFTAWFLFSGDFSAVSISAGFVFSLILSLTTYDTFIDDHEAARNMVFPRVIPAAALGWTLLCAMYVSSYRTAMCLLRGEISPRVVHFRSRLKSDVGRVALAQSISFTPGTITVELSDDHLVVHWLSATTRHSRRAGDEIKGGLEAAIKKVWL